MAGRKRLKRQPFRPEFLDLEQRRLMSIFQVTNTGDNGGVNPAPNTGTGTLRQAIVDSNATPGSNTIDFSIGTDAQTISVLSALPSITVPVTIDGTSQPGYTNAPLIDLDGTSAGTGVDGLVLAAGSDGSTVKALVISNFTDDGISITTTDNAIVSSYIGTNAAGTAAGSLPMAEGIVVTAARNIDRRHGCRRRQRHLGQRRRRRSDHRRDRNRQHGRRQPDRHRRDRRDRAGQH